ncbi:MAG: ORF6N domain-containing protein [Bacteroidia bacterium]
MQLQKIEAKIHEIRGQKVMLDFDLAELYEVENRALKQAVKRNLDRFPSDFMFQLSKAEWHEVITNCDNLPEGAKYCPATPFAFTEQGVAMLSSVLKSKKALQVNIAIMRAFVFIRQYALSHRDLTEKLKEIETKYNKQFKDVYEALNYLLNKDKQEVVQKERKRIGYKYGTITLRSKIQEVSRKKICSFLPN